MDITGFETVVYVCKNGMSRAVFSFGNHKKKKVHIRLSQRNYKIEFFLVELILGNYKRDS